MFDFILRVITLLCFFIRWLYWKRSEKIADKKKPKKNRTVISYISQIGWWFIITIPLIQILGFKILPFHSLAGQISGIILVTAGTAISLWARYILAANWANGYEYQVKQNQELVTKNIYSLIRHPIYLGLTVNLIGMELVAQSYLWISYLALFVAFYFQGKREEKNFLASRFGKDYKEYMKKTKMLIPFVL